ncbi:hypothetical protein CA13_31190 [Planctomycetes bacterium CA13]|uniref:Uncharacterized protein n=1 Tax=Novipirellula herctigrandis TaxID=2527986 RepID=A0A5C5Z3U5_9BACT|nr:hypothetical protein CA13_31190 [Planctomycetes bacterium CA13]
MWRIPTETDVEHRLKIDGGKPLFAWLDFRLLPAEVSHGITLSTAWVDSADDRWLTAIESAITQFVAARESAGRPVGRTAIEMSRVISHPVDTDDHAVTYNMLRALEAQFEQHEVETQP